MEMILGTGVRGGALLMIWAARNHARFCSDYAFDGVFPGKSHECLLGGFELEHNVLCFAGADRAALYLLPHPGAKRWYAGTVGFKRSLRIPWQDFKCRSGWAPLNKKIIELRFESRRAYLYVPREVGAALLTE